MKRIFLIGYMGAGKTTVGKILSKLLSLSFIDLDHHIESRYHQTISRLFEERGEAGFREIERKILREVGDIEDVLISTGGGAPCFYDNMQFMNEAGTTVYLKVSVDELAARLEVCKGTRPILQGKSGAELKDFISLNLQKREPLYSQASIIYDAEQMDTEKDVIAISQGLIKLL